jgi:uncharacterized membrane protein YkoI
MKASRAYGKGMITKTALLVSAALAAAVLLTPLMAEGNTEFMLIDSSPQDEAREAVRQGLVRPLEEILTEVRKTIKGDIVEIEFEKDDGRFIYEIEYVAPDGHLMEIKIDAKTLAVISIGAEDED